MRDKGNNNGDSNNGEKPKKERHIVSWSQEEDDILREQIRLHGTENWTVIASKFMDKTTRQCRRRWFTYLKSDFKKGGWSPEEDMLLCEAQRVFGNRWTEIAKVVSGRTDNAVKNRFTTLCKKRAKQEALAKENSDISYINLYNKRAIASNGINVDGGSETVAAFKKIRTCMISNQEKRISEDSVVVDHTLRHPFSVLAHNVHQSDANFPDQLLVCEEATAVTKSEGTFLKKNDPKVIALMQQAELLNSLATKVSSEKTDQSLESAWTVLEDHLKQKKESGLVENLSSCNEGSLPLWRESDMYESSPSSSEYSTGSTFLPNVPCNIAEGSQTQICVIKQNTIPELQPNQLNVQQSIAQETGICIGHDTSTNKENNVLICDDLKENNGALGDYPNAEFSSPLHVTPLFRALAAAIPSPKFSESEKHFLMKTLGMESPSSAPRTDPSRPPLCKRERLSERVKQKRILKTPSFADFSVQRITNVTNRYDHQMTPRVPPNTSQDEPFNNQLYIEQHDEASPREVFAGNSRATSDSC